MAELRVTELDFSTIKQNLISFLQAQDEFSDYNFEGSALNVLLDVLAYNTHYNAVLAHLQANEMFLDTAIKRSSVVSLAKTLGYTPRSVYSARAVVNLVVTAGNDATSMVLSPTDQFTSTANGQSFTFSPDQEYIADRVDDRFVFENVTLIEGTPLVNRFAVRADTVSGPFQIPADNIDLTTLSVAVIDSATENVSESYNRTLTIVDVGSDDKVYWVEETADEKYRLIFGDDVIGGQLTVGNIVVASYMASQGPAANGCRLFSSSGNIDGQVSIAVELVSRAASGSNRESIDSIRFSAPRFNTTRNRAVTAADYRSLILANFDKAKAVAVWGGEENNPPIYGRVFITIDPKDGYVITDGDKQYISNTILRPRSVLAIQHEFVDPDYIYMGFGVELLYNPKITSFTAGQLRALVIQEIEDYFTNTISTLDQTFFYSEFVDRIQTISPSIRSVLISMFLRRRLPFIIGETNSDTVDFITPIIPGSVRSTTFVTTVDEVEYVCDMHDYPDTIPSKATTGKLKVVGPDHTTILYEAGTIDYRRGLVYIDGVTISEYLGASPELVLSATPTELSKNISPKIIRTTEESEFAVAALPAKNTIIALDDSDANTAENLSGGISVSVRPFIESV